MRPAPPAALTDKGPVRSLNEDAWGWAALDEDIAVYVVADGMSGPLYTAEEVSRMAADLISQGACDRLRAQPERSLDALEGALVDAFRSANESLSAFEDRSATATAALVWAGRHAVIANVGDTRTYLFREQALRQITTDQTLVARMVELGRIQPGEARTHPNARILLQALGTMPDIEVDIVHLPLEAGDRLLLCTDGLWRELDDEALTGTMRSCEGGPMPSCQELMRAALCHEAEDNLTVMVVAVGGGG